MLCFLRSLYSSFCSTSSISIVSINSQNTFLCLDISSCLFSIQFRSCLIWCFRISRCVLVFSQWNRRWSMVWSLWPHVHLASSLMLNRLRYALVFPCPVSTAASFAFSVNFIPSLFCTDGKYCFVAAALLLAVQSACHFGLASSAAMWHRYLLGFLVYP